jgi:hypothetical protein
MSVPLRGRDNACAIDRVAPAFSEITRAGIQGLQSRARGADIKAFVFYRKHAGDIGRGK